MKYIIAFVFMFWGFMCGNVYSGAGEKGASFLRLGVGAKPASLGEAYSGVSGDLLSLYYNPAGLSSISGYKMSFSHALWFESIDYSNFTMGMPWLGGYMTVGINGLFMDDIEKYDYMGDPLDDKYSPRDMAVSLSYSRKVNSFSTGLAVKYITSEIDDEKAEAFACDIGIMRSFGKLNAGLAFQHIGTEIKFLRQGDPLPFTVRGGASYPFSIAGIDTLALAELRYLTDENIRLNGGLNMDFPINDILFSIRMGGRSYAEGLDALSHLTAGFGLGYKNIDFDYAFASFEDLGSTHRVSLSFFLPVEEDPIDEKEEEELEDEKRVQFIKAHVLFTDGEYEESIKEFRNFLKLEPGHATAKDYIQRATSKLKEELSPEEIDDIATDKFMDAHSLFAEGKYEQSIEIFKEVLELIPGHQQSKDYIERAKNKLR